MSCFTRIGFSFSRKAVAQPLHTAPSPAAPPAHLSPDTGRSAQTVAVLPHWVLLIQNACLLPAGLPAYKKLYAYYVVCPLGEVLRL